MGEFEVIASVVQRLASLAPADASGIVVGAGDDAAVLRIGSEEIVFTTDMAVEGVHFRRDWSTLTQIGARIAAANCADCEAMGASPSALVVALGGKIDQGMALELAEGIGTEAAKAGAVVVGGDMSSADSLVISIAAIGRMQGRSPVLRSGARVGDRVVMIGRTGRSAAGLALLSHGRSDDPAGLIAAYRTPSVPYGAGAQLAEAGASAMCDVSDGLLADLGHIAEASKVRIEIDPATLEISDLVGAAAEVGVDPLEWALTGGEDHALVATLPPDVPLPEQAISLGWVRESSAEEQSGVVVPGVVVLGVDTSAWKPGWDHFGQEPAGS